MKRVGFTIIEILFVLCIICGVAFFVVPATIDDTQQAKNVEKWHEIYNQTKYMFDVISAQIDDETIDDLQKDQDKKSRADKIAEMIKPYMRIKSNFDDKNYSIKYKNGIKVKPDEFYHFDALYLTEDEVVVGIKWLNNMDKVRPVAVMLFDINGKDAPNKWGIDIFGVNVFQDKIEPIGKGQSSEILQSDCSKKGNGAYCSYYYLVGGSFD